MKFEEPAIIDKLDAATNDQLDSLPFGVVRMNNENEILFYNRYESELSQLSPDSVVGKNLFVQVAPCTNNFIVSHKYSESSELDETIPYVFTYALKPTRVTLRLLKKTVSTNQYLLVRKES